MEKLQQLLNFTNKDGEVITLFDGKITLSQLVVIILAALVVIITLKLIKGVMKTITTVIAICFALVYFGIASPTQIKDAASIIAENGISTYSKIADASENIKIKGTSIELQIEGNWVDISKVSSFVESDDNTATVIIDGVGYSVEDSNIISLLRTFK